MALQDNYVVKLSHHCPYWAQTLALLRFNMNWRTANLQAILRAKRPLPHRSTRSACGPGKIKWRGSCFQLNNSHCIRSRKKAILHMSRCLLADVHRSNRYNKQIRISCVPHRRQDAWNCKLHQMQMDPHYAAMERRLSTTVRSTGEGDTAAVISEFGTTGSEPRGARVGRRGTRAAAEDAHRQACTWPLCWPVEFVYWPVCWPSIELMTGVNRAPATGPDCGSVARKCASLGFASPTLKLGTSFSRPARAHCVAAAPGFKASAGIVLLRASLTAAATRAARGDGTRVPDGGEDSRFKTGEASGRFCGDCSRRSGVVASRLMGGDVSRLSCGDVSRLICGEVSRLRFGDVSRLKCGEGSRRGASLFDDADGSRFVLRRRGRRVTERDASERDASSVLQLAWSRSRIGLVPSSSVERSDATWAASAFSSAAAAFEGLWRPVCTLDRGEREVSRCPGRGESRGVPVAAPLGRS